VAYQSMHCMGLGIMGMPQTSLNQSLVFDKGAGRVIHVHGYAWCTRSIDTTWCLYTSHTRGRVIHDRRSCDTRVDTFACFKLQRHRQASNTCLCERQTTRLPRSCARTGCCCHGTHAVSLRVEV
jgi:hypothetical protein